MFDDIGLAEGFGVVKYEGGGYDGGDGVSGTDFFGRFGFATT